MKLRRRLLLLWPSSGAKSISLDISGVPADVHLDLQVGSGQEIAKTEEFYLKGNGKESLQI